MSLDKTQPKRISNLGNYKVYKGTQSLLVIVPAGVQKHFQVKEGDYVNIYMVDDGWLIIPVKEKSN